MRELIHGWFMRDDDMILLMVSLSEMLATRSLNAVHSISTGVMASCVSMKELEKSRTSSLSRAPRLPLGWLLSVWPEVAVDIDDVMISHSRHGFDSGDQGWAVAQEQVECVVKASWEGAMLEKSYVFDCV